MITASDIYWITRLDSFICASWVIIVLLLLCLVVLMCTIPWDELSNEKSYLYDDAKRKLRWMKRTGIALILLLAAQAFIPTTKEAAAMYAVPKIVDSTVIKEDLPELYDMGVKALKEWLTEEQKTEKVN